MKTSKPKELLKLFIPFVLFFSFLNAKGALLEKEGVSSLHFLLPDVVTWKIPEAPQDYFPEILFEYINGAAEIYLSYDFKELTVGQYEKGDSNASLIIEIYDMGNEINSFGIYSAERFPDSQFISLGNQGYLEEETLNFIVGKYYIKLLCFDSGEDSADFLKLFSQEVVKRVKDKGTLPPALAFFPKQGLVRNSEKFILRNFMGYSFLHSGYLANYKLEDLEFDCFLIEGENADDAQNMLKKYLEKKGKQSVEEISAGYRIKDRYYHNIYLARVENYLCGVMKIKDESLEVGDKYFGMLIESLKK
ncbi:MAG: hypothetical protein E3I52_01160 [Candidatus Aminicenantes bacterium]|nr:MAG: hypothetical protein E3I52_01160 [Candidatus Aminicenantes bacterium]